MQHDGILPLRLLEPATSLEVTPFAGKAIRATGLNSIRELAEFVFDRPEECRTMGQAHLEEIRTKIEQFVGRPPYTKTDHLDLQSLLRLFLQNLDPQDRSFFLLYTNLASLVPVNPSLIKEAQMALSRNKLERFNKVLMTLKGQRFDDRKALVKNIYEGIVQPWVASLGGVVHKEELYAFAYTRSSLQSYDAFDQTMKILGLVMGETFLFESSLFAIKRGVYTETENLKNVAVQLLDMSDALLSNQYQNAADLAFLLAKNLPLRRSRIRSLLFWAYRFPALSVKKLSTDRLC